MDQTSPVPTSSKPTLPGTPTRLWVALGMLALIIVVAVIVYLKYRASSQAPANQINPLTQVQQKEVPFNKLPDKFPPELIALEQGAKLLQNYNASKPGAPFQATRVYETKKSLDEAIGVYKKFFNDNEWAIKKLSNAPQIKAIVAQNHKLLVQVNASENITTKVRTVDVTVMVLAN